jgi:FMN-dependent NADH-azoreductase
MKTLLRIDASVRHEGSYSRTLGDFFVSQWQKQNPDSLKAYIDHVVRNNETIQYTSEGYRGLLTGKKAYIITVTGGKRPVPATYEAFENYLKNILGFIGIRDAVSFSLEGTADQEYVKGMIERTKDEIAATFSVIALPDTPHYKH